MRIVNIIILYNQDYSKVLMCLRQKNPYKGLCNFVGGKLEGNETRLESAYRELHEETGISPNQVELKEAMSFVYHHLDYELFIAMGSVDEKTKVVSEKHPLEWIDVTENFEDRSRFAGDGNIQHMLDVLKYNEFNFD